MKAKKPRITRCALCRYFMESKHFKCWFCALKHHPAEPDDRCTFGEESK